MEGFDKIRDLNLADLDKPGDLPEENPEDIEETEEVTAPVEDTTESKEIPEKKKEMEIQGQYYKAESKMTAQMMREFLFGHYYRTPMILLITAVGIGLFIYGFVSRPINITYVVSSLILVIGYPFSFVTRANKIVKTNAAFQNTFYYTFDEWGVHLKNGDQIIDLAWKYVTRVKRMKNLVVLYTGKSNGYLIPYEDLGSQKEEIVSFIEKMQKSKRGY